MFGVVSKATSTSSISIILIPIVNETKYTNMNWYQTYEFSLYAHIENYRTTMPNQLTEPCLKLFLGPFIPVYMYFSVLMSCKMVHGGW